MDPQISTKIGKFKALRVHQAEGGTRAAIEQLSLDDLNPGEVVIRVAYSSVNYKDALAVTGRGKILRGFPRVAGVDLSGTVVASDSSEILPGERVLVTGCDIGEGRDGGFAEYARVPASAVVHLPAGLSLFEAMALGTAGFTAGFTLRRFLENHQAPEMGTIAVSGATGGVGSVALSVFKRAGFKLAAITGKAGKAEAYLRDMGADEVIDRASLASKGAPMEKAIWGGAIDNLGGPMLAYFLRTVRPLGNIASIGLAQSSELEASVMPFILRGVSILGITSSNCPRPWRLAIWERLAAEWKPPLLARIAPRLAGLDDVPRICDELLSGAGTGRTVISIAGEG